MQPLLQRNWQSFYSWPIRGSELIGFVEITRPPGVRFPREVSFGPTGKRATSDEGIKLAPGEYQASAAISTLNH